MKKLIAILGTCLLLPSCSPLKTSPNDEKHQLELTLHEVQTNLDDLRHDINCYQTELQIVDGRIKYFENTLSSLKQNELEAQQSKIDHLTQSILSLEKKFMNLDKDHEKSDGVIEDLTSHANETSAALSQFKDRIAELEQELFSHDRKLNEVSKLKTHVDKLSSYSIGKHKLYRVKPGDSLEKIARANKIDVDKIKQINDLEKDKILIGQELKIPLQ